MRLAALLLAAAAAEFVAAADTPLSPANEQQQRPSTANCTWRYFNQSLDHFSPGATAGHGATFQQRLCINEDSFAGEGSPILFYTGNESPVDEYVNNTGLMWELAEDLGALIVFAEHRYEPLSHPALCGTQRCSQASPLVKRDQICEQRLLHARASRVCVNAVVAAS